MCGHISVTIEEPTSYSDVRRTEQSERHKPAHTHVTVPQASRWDCRPKTRARAVQMFGKFNCAIEASLPQECTAAMLSPVISVM